MLFRKSYCLDKMSMFTEYLQDILRRSTVNLPYLSIVVRVLPLSPDLSPILANKDKWIVNSLNTRTILWGDIRVTNKKTNDCNKKKIYGIFFMSSLACFSEDYLWWKIIVGKSRWRYVIADSTCICQRQCRNCNVNVFSFLFCISSSDTN